MQFPPDLLEAPMVSMTDLTAEYSRLQKRLDQSYPGKQRLLLLEEMQRVLDRMKVVWSARTWN
jgi:hypothetical protein